MLADAAQIEGRWDSALDLKRLALEIEKDLEDVPAQIGSYAALAFQSMVVERFDQAAWAATQCLELAHPGDRTRFTTIARCSLAEARWRTDPGPDVRREVERAREELLVARDIPSPIRVWLEQRLAVLPSRSALRISVENWLARLWRHARAKR